MVSIPENGNSDLPRVLKFTEFAEKYRNDKIFKDWFDPVLTLLKGVKDEPNNLYKCRLVIFLINLQSFINFYDPKSKITKKRSFDFLDKTQKNFRTKVISEVSEVDKKMIINITKNDLK